MQHLQPNTTLQGGKYKIERVLGQGGFGNTYVGYNTVFNEQVAIKEFFMQGINERDEDTDSVTISIERNRDQFQEQLEKFKKEALRIRKLNNPHIVKVDDFFEENGTAYYVMDYVDGENLSQRLKRTGKPMSEKKVCELLMQILDALNEVYQNKIWHLDLKPANIMMDKDGNVKLIDFGASKQLDAQKSGATTNTAISYTNGYAPREQMEQNYEKFGPWTDFYALGATLYCLLTNKRPPLPSDIDDDESEDKHESLPMPESISTSMKELVLWLMNTSRMKRPQSVDEILARIETDHMTKSARKKKPEPKKETKQQPKEKNVEEKSEETIIGDSEETIVVPKVNPTKPTPKTREKPQPVEEDLSYLDDSEETWMDKLKEKLTDLKNIGIVIAVIVGSGVIRELITCDGFSSMFSNHEKDFAALYERSLNPNLTEVEMKEVAEGIENLYNKEYGPAVFRLGEMISESNSEEGDKLKRQAAKYLSKEAERGDPYAQYYLGMCYLEGHGVTPDYNEGKQWLIKAAESNNQKFLFDLGNVIQQWEGDSLKAFEYYKKAADLGEVEACLKLGEYYRDGMLVNQDYAKALEYYIKAAEKGNSIAYVNIGTIYFLSYRDYTYYGEDLGVEKDLNKAIYNLDASLKIVENVDAHYWLGLCYWFAKDENKDDSKAFDHIRIAAEGNHPAAQMQLYFFYCHGIGVEPNQKLAQQWRKKAIENGYEEE